MTKALVVGKKVFDLIERQPQIESKAKDDSKVQISESIEFKDVYFRYPTSVPTQPSTLQGVSFAIKAGTSTAIVGPSGSGKSTIAQLIERFYDPAKGEILFDGKNLKDLDLSQLRSSIGYVS